MAFMIRAFAVLLALAAALPAFAQTQRETLPIPRFVSLDVHHDPSQVWVLLFSALVIGGLLAGLFVPRRRVWVKVVAASGGLTLEYAGLARGEDPTLAAAVPDLAEQHSQQLAPKVDS